MSTAQLTTTHTMTTLTEKLRRRYFGDSPHPYRTLEQELARRIRPDDVLLDAGCGRDAEILSRFTSNVKTAIGIDVVTFVPGNRSQKIRLVNADLEQIALRRESVDCAISRSVLEHVKNPSQVYNELYRILKPGGRFIFLTPNLWDYGAIASKLIPNSLHPWIVRKLEGREEDDTFPTYYRSNTPAAVRRLARDVGFAVEAVRFLGQYPSYCMCNPLLFLIGTAYEKLLARFQCLHRFRGWLLVVLVKPTI
jgi:SAM-dependent methyltransferase